MLRHALSSFVAYIIALGVMMWLSYALPLWLPGDFATAMFASSDVVLSAEAESALAHTPVSFFAYASAFLRGDFGVSLVFGVPISTLLKEALPWTMLLGFLGYGTAFVVAFVLGVESAFRRGSAGERTLSGALVALDGIPELVLGVGLLLVFGVSFGWFPLQGALTPYGDAQGSAYVLDVLNHAFLPALTLFLGSLSGQFLLVRASVLGAVNAAYVQQARFRGLAPWRVRYRYGALNALGPIVVRFGYRLAGMVTGLVVVETIFSYPGVGSLLLDAIAKRDIGVVQVVVTLMAFGVIGVGMVLDVLGHLMRPKGGGG